MENFVSVMSEKKINFPEDLSRHCKRGGKRWVERTLRILELQIQKATEDRSV
jgi:hypothetical protein